MAGKSGGITVLILVIAVFAVIGCSVPLGTIGGELIATYVALLAEYQKTYNKNDFFRLESDYLKVFTVNRSNETTPVLLNACEIYIIEDPNGTREPSPRVQAPYQFLNEGPKVILVKYEGNSVECNIVVQPSGSDGGQTSGITFVWVGQES